MLPQAFAAEVDSITEVTFEGITVWTFEGDAIVPEGFLLLGNCFRARRTGNGQNVDGRRGVRGSAYAHRRFRRPATIRAATAPSTMVEGSGTACSCTAPVAAPLIVVSAALLA